MSSLKEFKEKALFLPRSVFSITVFTSNAIILYKFCIQFSNQGLPRLTFHISEVALLCLWLTNFRNSCCFFTVPLENDVVWDLTAKRKF